MSTKQVTKWVRRSGPELENLEIGNFGNNGVVPKSVSFKGKKFNRIPGSVILKDAVGGNLILKRLVVGNHVEMFHQIEGTIHLENCRIGDYLHVWSYDVSRGIVVKNSTAKGVFFWGKETPFSLVNLSNSRFDYLYFRSSIEKLILEKTEVIQTVSLGERFFERQAQIQGGRKVIKKIQFPDGYGIGNLSIQGG